MQQNVLNGAMIILKYGTNQTLALMQVIQVGVEFLAGLMLGNGLAKGAYHIHPHVVHAIRIGLHRVDLQHELAAAFADGFLRLFMLCTAGFDQIEACIGTGLKNPAHILPDRRKGGQNKIVLLPFPVGISDGVSRKQFSVHGKMLLSKENFSRL